jgi:acyl-CoA thioesterase FadM
MAYVERIQVRFDDVDYARIFDYPRLFIYCHWVFEDFFHPIVSAKADFQSPLRFGEILSWITREYVNGVVPVPCGSALRVGVYGC